jgi:hypothetical protein
MEQEATSITCFAMYFLPGLLQTEDYARAIIKGIVPKIAPAILDQRVEARMRRQQLLDQPKPPRYRALLDEATLYRQVGGPAVMKAQLEKLLRCVQEEKATIQVIPFDVGAHAAMDSNFDYLEFEGFPLPSLVFVECLVLHLYLDRPEQLRRHAEVLEYLRDEALSPRDSAKRIEKIHDGAAFQSLAEGVANHFGAPGPDYVDRSSYPMLLVSYIVGSRSKALHNLSAARI